MSSSTQPRALSPHGATSLSLQDNLQEFTRETIQNAIQEVVNYKPIKTRKRRQRRNTNSTRTTNKRRKTSFQICLGIFLMFLSLFCGFKVFP